MSKDLYQQLSDERKQHQADGLMPDWYTTAGWQMFKEKYLYEADSVRAQFERIAKTAAKHLSKIGMEDVAFEKFFNMMWNGWLSCSTPVLANMGTNRGMPVSCSGGSVVDSVDGFYKARHETAMLTKYGFGTSAYLGAIRARGSKISKGGKASGVIPVFKGFVQDMRDIAQGSSRRGAWAGYLPIEHKDFDELADFVLSEPDDANVGWNVSNEFIEKLNNGDQEALRRYQKAMKLKMVTGKGYFCFIDKINAKRPESYVKNNLYVKGSNLCVAPETLILTDEGYQQIASLENESVNVWNGKEFSTVVVKKTGQNQKLVKVITNSGFELECTPYHKFYVVTRDENLKTTVVEKSAIGLCSGDKLIKCEFPIIEGSQKLDNAYENGLYSAVGRITETGQRIYLYHDRLGIKKHLNLNIFKNWEFDEELNREYGVTNVLMNKFFVPNGDYLIESKIKWLEGLLDGKGVAPLHENGEIKNIQFTSSNKNFLLEIQMMLQTIGISSKVVMEMRFTSFYDSETENDKTWHTIWKITLGQAAINTLHSLGFKTNRLKTSCYPSPNREYTQFAKVVDVVDEGRIGDTYCFTEPKRGMGVFNGILTGQCDEITLFSDDEHTFTCVLSSLNVAKFDEWKDTDTAFWATVFLDCVAEEFIQKAEGIPGLEKAINFTKKGRALGLGQCGLHTYFQSKMIPFESLTAHMLSTSIAKHIEEESLKASKWLATLLGEPEWCKGIGIRNTHRIAVAPTKSTAVLMGGVSEGINPDPAMSYTQMTAAGEVERINPTLLEIMKNRGAYTKQNITDIKDKMGSVQHVSWLSDEEKAVFKTAFEIDQEVIIRMASVRANHIDQWQSLNLFFAADEDPAWISRVHKKAFNDPNILGLYYIYTQAGVQASKEECQACQ